MRRFTESGLRRGPSLGLAAALLLVLLPGPGQSAAADEPDDRSGADTSVLTPGWSDLAVESEPAEEPSATEGLVAQPVGETS